jgi:hypothetical protein
MRCFDCQPLLLDHLYGLLDPAEAAAVEEHLTGCVGCADARDRVAHAAGLFARAAKVSFPQVHFAPPADAVPAAAVAPARRERVWGRWAVAAAVWAVVPAALVPLARLDDRADVTRAAADAAFAAAKVSLADADAAAVRRAAVEARYADAKAQTGQTVAAWVAAERAADATAKARPAEVLVTRPETAQPGAPNTFAVVLRPRGDALAGRPVTAEVRDGSGAVLHTEPLNPAVADEPQPVRLPASAWAKLAPGAELFLVVSTTDPAGARVDLLDPVRLFGPVYATMLVTDRATYRPGDRVYFRSLTLDRTTFRPPPHEQALTFSLRKRDGAGVPHTTVYGTTAVVAEGGTAPVTGPDGQPVRGVGVGEITLPADLPEGDYLLTLTEVPGRGGRPAAVSVPVTRDVRVRAGRAEVLAKTITFGSTPAPGQPVTVWAEARLGGRPVVGADVAAVVTADGSPTAAVVRVHDKKTDITGRARLLVVLPGANDLPRGDVRLKVTFRTRDVEESVAERVPVAGKDVIVEFFPEGGTLVAGVPNRVYVRATTPAGLPVDVRGVVAAGGGDEAKVVAPADTKENSASRGLGVVTFTPKADAKYQLRLDGRPGRTFDLPPAEADGVVMTVLDPVTGPGRPVRLQLVSARADRKLVVGAYTRGRLADTKAVAVKAGEPVEVTLLAGTDPRGGVVRLTVFEDAAGFRPVAERLVFRRPGEVLNLALGSPATGADGAVSLPLTATDEKGRPAAAILWAAAVNAASAPGAKDRSLPTHFLLAGEIETPDDLEHADFLLTDAPTAAAGLDLVLATQGWRRFVEQQPAGAAVAGRRNTAVDRLLALNGAGPVGPDTNPAHRRLFETYWPRYEAAVRAQDEARATRAEPLNLGQVVAAYEARRRETAELVAAAETAAAPLVAVRGWVNVAAAGLGLVVVGMAALGAARPKGVRGLTPLAVSAGGAGLLALFLAQLAPSAGAAAGGEYALPAPPPVTPAGADPDQEGVPVTPSLPLAPPPQIAKVNQAGRVEPPPVFSGFGNPEKAPAPRVVTPSLFPPVPTPFGPGAPIPDADLQKGKTPDAPPMTMMMAPSAMAVAPAPPADHTTDVALRRARELTRPIDAAFPDAAARDAVLERLRASVPWVPPLVVREYAAPRPGSGSPSGESDTVLWRPLIVLPADGATTITFFPGAVAGGYEVLVAGHTPDGRIGTVRRVVPGTRK